MKKIAAIVIASSLALGLSACGEQEYDPNYVGVCEDRNGNRVEDRFCPDPQTNSSGMNGFFWGYLLGSSTMPRYGQHVVGSVRVVDETRYNVYRGGVPAKGGAIDFKTYKPVASKVSKPDMAVTSKKYKDTFVSADSTYKRKNVDSNVYNKNSSIYKAPAPAYKAPAPVYKPAPRR